MRWAAGHIASRAAGLAAALLAVGCAGVPQAPERADPLSGRLSVQVEGDAQRSFHAAFDLTGSPAQGSLALNTPLGTQVARAEWSDGQVRLRSRGSERVFPDLDALSEEALGERVPLAALFDWLRARPWPGAASDPTTRGFTQLGWAVDLSRYDEGWVVAERSAPPAVTVRARLDAAEPRP